MLAASAQIVVPFALAGGSLIFIAVVVAVFFAAAAEALEAAAAQGKFFELLDQLSDSPVKDETGLLDLATRSVADRVVCAWKSALSTIKPRCPANPSSDSERRAHRT